MNLHGLRDGGGVGAVKAQWEIYGILNRLNQPAKTFGFSIKESSGVDIDEMSARSGLFPSNSTDEVGISLGNGGGDTLAACIDLLSDDDH